jgi:hypothetical protein
VLDSSGWPAQIASVFGALLFASAPLFWSQSNIVEVYSFGELLLSAFLLCLALWLRQPRRRYAVATTIALALLTSHHPPFGLGFVGLLIVACQRRLPIRGWIEASAPVLLVPLLFGTLWLRASFHPALNWGEPTTFARLFSHVTAQEYRSYLIARPFADELPRVPAATALLLRQSDWIGAALAALGGIWLWTERRLFLLLPGTLAGLMAVFTVLFNAENTETYLLPMVQFAALSAAVGAAWVLSALDRGYALVATLGLAVLIAWHVVSAWPEVDVSGDLEARQWGDAILASAPPKAILRTHRDEDTFVLWYLHYAEGQRPDVTVIDDRLLEVGWYREQLARIDPRLLQLPNPSSP